MSVVLDMQTRTKRGSNISGTKRERVLLMTCETLQFFVLNNMNVITVNTVHAVRPVLVGGVGIAVKIDTA